MNKLGLFVVMLFLSSISFAQLAVNAGQDKFICPAATTAIGGSPTVSGGFPPYTITWAPSTGLSSSTIQNPTATGINTITYTLTVKDSRDSIKTDQVSVVVDDILKMGAGNDKEYCLTGSNSVLIGASTNYLTPYTFKWSPSYALSDTTSPQVTASPTVTTNYTVQIISPLCGVKTDVVTVSVYTLEMSAGADTTINQGESITLFASPNDSSLTYEWWSSTSSLNYNTTYNPDVSPRDTAVFWLTIRDEHGCSYLDSVKVNVKPSSALVFYNSLTPNGDGDNDIWVIGNLEKYRTNRLQIFNRYGQEIYAVTNYKNDWAGKYLGKDLPAGTYFFVLDTKSDEGIKKGSITIYR
jgi:gliding motility-associated-like protein